MDMDCKVKGNMDKEIVVSGEDLLKVLREKEENESIVEGANRLLFNKLANPVELYGAKQKYVRTQIIEKNNNRTCSDEKEGYEGWVPCKQCWKALAKHVFKHWGKYCLVCGSKDALSLHHVKPRLEGGNHDESNLVPLCNECHDFIELHESRPRTADAIISLGRER